MLVYYGKGYKAPTIAKLLHKEGLQCSRVGLSRNFKILATSIDALDLTSEIKQVVEEQIQQDDETTAMQFHSILTDKGLSCLPENNTSLLNVSWMGVSRKCLLPAYP